MVCTLKQEDDPQQKKKSSTVFAINAINAAHLQRLYVQKISHAHRASGSCANAMRPSLQVCNTTGLEVAAMLIMPQNFTQQQPWPPAT